MSDITKLLDEALTYPDYDQCILLLIANLISADENDTPEKEALNNAYLREIYKYCCKYEGDKKEYMNRMADRIKGYLGDKVEQ